MKAFVALLPLVACVGSAHAEVLEKGPNGGHLIDAGDRFHLELVAAGQELRLFVSDTKDRKLPVAGASAKATVFASGGKSTLELKPAGEGLLKGTGVFAPTRAMKVDLVLTLPGQPSAVVGKFQPLAASGEGKHDHAGHKH